MSALSSLSDWVSRATGGNSGTPQNLFFNKDARIGAAAATATTAGRWSSLWQYNGSPSDGAAPTTAAIPDNTLAGTLKQASPGGGRQQYLVGGQISSSQGGTLRLYDRLLHIGGLSGTSTSAQAVQSGGSPALTRYTNGAGNQIWLELISAIGATGTTVTASYTNQAAASKTSQAVSIGGTGLSEAQRMIPLTLAQGDTGVQGVASITLAASTTGAGNIAVVVMQPILDIPIVSSGIAQLRDLLSGPPASNEIISGAALAWAWFANGTTAPQIFGSVHLVEA